MPVSRLTPLQRDVLWEFFRREQRFFLTGGGALAGFHLGHRPTDDLDLFTASDVLDEGRDALAQVARGLGATLEVVSDAPTIKRLMLRRGHESAKIDLVHDTRQLLPKLVVDDLITLDSMEEIAANKLTAILSRSEIRDIVDLRALEAVGIRLEEAVPRAMEKDGGLTPAQLVDVLSEIRIGDDAEIEGGVSVSELRSYVESLIDRLARLAYPR